MNDIIIDLHTFQEICIKLKEIEDNIDKLHELMDKARVFKPEDMIGGNDPREDK